MLSRQLPTDAAGHPKPNAQRTFTDPDSHILKGSAGWMQGYSAQAAVDGDHQVIVAIGISNQASDAAHLLPMLERIKANTSRVLQLLRISRRQPRWVRRALGGYEWLHQVGVGGSHLNP